MTPISRPDAIHLLGLSVRHFARLESEGILRAASRRRTGNLYDPAILVKGYLAYLHGMNGKPRDRRDLAQAELLELRHRRERGDVISRAAYIKHGQLLAAAVSAKLRAIPSRLVRAGVLVDAQEPTALAAVDEVLQEIAAWKTEHELRQAIPDGPDAA
jgi:phage terminase Nu1 subunit (DNA packaging protein)